MYYRYMGNDVSIKHKSHCIDNFSQHIYVSNHLVLEAKYTGNTG